MNTYYPVWAGPSQSYWFYTLQEERGDTNGNTVLIFIAQIQNSPHCPALDLFLFPLTASSPRARCTAGHVSSSSANSFRGQDYLYLTSALSLQKQLTPSKRMGATSGSVPALTGGLDWTLCWSFTSSCSPLQLKGGIMTNLPQRFFFKNASCNVEWWKRCLSVFVWF